MNDVIFVVKDLQPAAIIVVAVVADRNAVEHVAAARRPMGAMVAVAGVTAYVGHRVLAVDPRPAWLLPLAVAGVAMAAAGAGTACGRRFTRPRTATSTIGYIFPTALAICALWLSIALIEFDASQITAVVAR